MICGVVTASTLEECKRAMAISSQWVDCFELRLDYMDRVDLPSLLEGRKRPVIVTCRPSWEGGRFEAGEERRLAFLREADALGADYVDVEAEARGRLGSTSRARLIVSKHDFQGFPSDLNALEKEIRGKDSDIVKVAATPRDCFDSLAMLRFLSGAEDPVIGLCMGSSGAFTRVLGPLMGSYLTYGILEDLEGSAPGQCTVRDLCTFYGLSHVCPDTEIYGVMGDPIAHSKSPQIHNAAFRELGIDAVYVAFHVERDPVRFIEEVMDLGVKGLSITVPHKRLSMDAMHWVDPVAAKIGAMNTVCLRDGQRAGYNTDWSAAVYSIEASLFEGEALSGLEAVVIGAGGVARAVVFGLMQRGAKVTIVNRTVSKAKALASEAGCAWAGLEQLNEARWDVVAHCTTVGMWPHGEECLVPKAAIEKARVVYDTVYNPPETALLAEATEAGCVTVSGIEHFIRQAAEQFELWTQQKAPTEIMEVAMGKERDQP